MSANSTTDSLRELTEISHSQYLRQKQKTVQEAETT